MKIDPDELDLAVTPEADRPSGQKTAKAAAAILLELNSGFVIPTAKQREAILVAFVLEGFVVYGKAFDIVRLEAISKLPQQDDDAREVKKPLIVAGVPLVSRDE